MSKFKTLVASIKAHVKTIDVDQLHFLIEQQEPITLIDVRETSTYQEKGHIPSAIHIPRGRIEINIEAQCPENDTMIILYCGGGSHAALAADNLMKMGYDNVYSLIGGFKSWSLVGHTIEAP